MKNHYDDPECITRGDGQTSRAGITVPLSGCGTIRRRSVCFLQLSEIVPPRNLVSIMGVS